jgi:hypothetical protein
VTNSDIKARNANSVIIAEFSTILTAVFQVCVLMAEDHGSLTSWQNLSTVNVAMHNATYVYWLPVLTQIGANGFKLMIVFH